MIDFGFSSNRELEKHTRMFHPDKCHESIHKNKGAGSSHGYESASHGKFDLTQNVRAEDRTQSTKDIQSRRPTDDGYASAMSRNPESDDIGTVYSDVSSLSTLEKEKYISELADDLFDKVRSQQPDQHTMERISENLPALLKAFALKVSHDAPSQIHRDVMFFVHMYRR